MGRHAYLILAHKNPEQLRYLVEMLDDKRNDIFIHIDAKARFGKEALTGVAKHSNVYFTPRRLKVNWGGVSIMKAELELLKIATANGHYDYYHLLSGQDLPIKTQDDIHEFFDSNAGKEFLNLWEFRNSTRTRFERFTLFPEGEGRFPTRILNHFFKGVQIMTGYKINRGVDFKFGSQWFSITDGFARYVLDNESWLNTVFANTSTCDEIFLPTLLWRSPFKDKLYDSTVVPDQKEVNQSNMRYIDWTRGESIRHPWVFRKEDFDSLMSLPHLWARKFDVDVDRDVIVKLKDTLAK